jgi:phosphoserine phosphatase RsbU/P
MMARTHASFRGIAARPDAARLFRAPEEAVRLVNATLAAGNSSCMFVTLLIAAFDGTTNRLTYVRAGHVPPFLRRAGGAVELLDAAGGLPLGLMEDAAYTSAVVDLAPGDELLILTDGITEATAPSGALFGDARVVELVRHPEFGGAALLDQLLAKVRLFEAGAPQADDIAAILLKLETG